MKKKEPAKYANVNPSKVNRFITLWLGLSLFNPTICLRKQIKCKTKLTIAYNQLKKDISLWCQSSGIRILKIVPSLCHQQEQSSGLSMKTGQARLDCWIMYKQQSCDGYAAKGNSTSVVSKFNFWFSRSIRHPLKLIVRTVCWEHNKTWHTKMCTGHFLIFWKKI